MKTTSNALIFKIEKHLMQIKDICTIVPTISIGYDRKIKYMYTYYEWPITKRGQLGSHRSLMVYAQDLRKLLQIIKVFKVLKCVKQGMKCTRNRHL